MLLGRWAFATVSDTTHPRDVSVPAARTSITAADAKVDTLPPAASWPRRERDDPNRNLHDAEGRTTGDVAATASRRRGDGEFRTSTRGCANSATESKRSISGTNPGSFRAQTSVSTSRSPLVYPREQNFYATSDSSVVCPRGQASTATLGD